MPTLCVAGSFMTTSTRQLSSRLTVEMTKSSLARYTLRPIATRISLCLWTRPAAWHVDGNTDSTRKVVTRTRFRTLETCDLFGVVSDLELLRVDRIVEATFTVPVAMIVGVAGVPSNRGVYAFIEHLD